MTAVIEAEGLRKQFGKTVALDGLDLVAESGKMQGARPSAESVSAQNQYFHRNILC